MNTDSPTGTTARQLVQRMGEAAENFLAALSTDQRATAQLDFANQAERTTWYYTPTPRQGLPFTEMDRNQQRLAQKLVMSGLSRGGYNIASIIMGLETLLDAKEGFERPNWWRDSRLYHLTIFGAPDDRAPWGWRFEGHHISLNYTIAGGQIVAPTPTFFGSNPAESPLIGNNVLRPLAGIEDLARDLMHALSADQQRVALLTPIAPPDIVMLNRPFVVEGALPAQTPASTMSAGQQEILLALIGDYIHRMPEELAEIELNKVKQQGIGNIHFAWAGGIERREAHYYRLQAPRFLVEYDNTQNDANHIHSVWRDPANDFGADILAQHYATSHHH
jgi:hypothetical protein